MTIKEINDKLTQSIEKIINGDTQDLLIGLDEIIITENDNSGTKELLEKVKILANKHIETKDFISNLAFGNLYFEAPKHNRYIDIYKELQSNLRHLVWQVEQIASGDYSQRIEFSGDFTKSFEKLSLALNRKEQAEIALKESEKKFRILTESIASGIFAFQDFKFIMINPTVTKITGYTLEDLADKNFIDIVHPDDRELVNFYALNRQNDDSIPSRFELRIIAKSGEIIWIDLFSNNVIFEEKPTTLNTFFDITARKNIELELKELNQTKDKFFSIIAHDLRTPFNAFLGLTEVMLEDMNKMSISEIQELAQMLNKSANNLYALLENLLEWAHLQRQKVELDIEHFNLLNSVTQSIKPSIDAAINKNISLVTNIDSSIELITDKNMLQAIIRNIVSNAVKYTNRGGRITITANQKSTSIEINIQDNGIGMNQTLLNKLFKIDEKIGRPGTEDEPTTGLGLLLCKDYIEKLKGNISVESEENKGTIFHLSFPLETGNQSLFIKKDKKAQSPPLKTILVAEDDDINYKFLSIILTKEN
jgi:PAS domain S-box-containing protein